MREEPKQGINRIEMRHLPAWTVGLDSNCFHLSLRLTTMQKGTVKINQVVGPILDNQSSFSGETADDTDANPKSFG